jgi:hypothetical protein
VSGVNVVDLRNPPKPLVPGLPDELAALVERHHGPEDITDLVALYTAGLADFDPRVVGRVVEQVIDTGGELPTLPELREACEAMGLVVANEIMAVGHDPELADRLRAGYPVLMFQEDQPPTMQERLERSRSAYLDAVAEASRLGFTLNGRATTATTDVANVERELEDAQASGDEARLCQARGDAQDIYAWAAGRIRTRLAEELTPRVAARVQRANRRSGRVPIVRGPRAMAFRQPRAREHRASRRATSRGRPDRPQSGDDPEPHDVVRRAAA